MFSNLFHLFSFSNRRISFVFRETLMTHLLLYGNAVVKALNQLLGDNSNYQAQLQLNIAAVIRASQATAIDAFYKWSGKCVQCIILSFFLFISMLVQPCSKRRDSHIGMNKFIIDQTNNFHFILCNLQFSIYPWKNECLISYSLFAISLNVLIQISPTSVRS